MKRETSTELTTLHKARYGTAAPKPNQCCAEVSGANANLLYQYKQCSRPRGYGPERAYCKQHSPEAIERRRAESDAAWRESSLKMALGWDGPTFYRVLCQIADGHSDPQALAAEAVARHRRSEK